MDCLVSCISSKGLNGLETTRKSFFPTLVTTIVRHRDVMNQASECTPCMVRRFSQTLTAFNDLAARNKTQSIGRRLHQKAGSLDEQESADDHQSGFVDNLRC